jgi:hypothetical protein
MSGGFSKEFNEAFSREATQFVLARLKTPKVLTIEFLGLCAWLQIAIVLVLYRLGVTAHDIESSMEAS